MRWPPAAETKISIAGIRFRHHGDTWQVGSTMSVGQPTPDLEFACILKAEMLLEIKLLQRSDTSSAHMRVHRCTRLDEPGWTVTRTYKYNHMHENGRAGQHQDTSASNAEPHGRMDPSHKDDGGIPPRRHCENLLFLRTQR